MSLGSIWVIINYKLRKISGEIELAFVIFIWENLVKSLALG